MYINVPQTPNAVVICVIIFNAAFGFRCVLCVVVIDQMSRIFTLTCGFTNCVTLTVGVRFRGYIHQRYVPNPG